MDFDQTKKIEVEVSENVIAERAEEEPRRPERRRRTGLLRGVDPLDVALLPVVLGVFVSLGFLFAGLFGGTAAVSTVSEIGSTLASVL